MKFFFETYGCQMNVAESNALENTLLSCGWEEAECPEDGDLIIINTCAVRYSAETRIFGRLGFYCGLKNQGKDFVLLVTGCMAEKFKETLKEKYPSVDVVIGNFQKSGFKEFLQSLEDEKTNKIIEPTPHFIFPENCFKKGEFSSFVPIMNGCNNFCSYCIVPYVRGREISRNHDDILAEIDLLSANNCCEVTLLGQNVNSYRSADVDFPLLLEKIAKRLEESASSIKWVRFMSSHPKDLSPRLIEVIAANPVFCRHIHLPVQSGSDRILKEMNRKYTRDHYLSLCKSLREKVPSCTISTDILVGFPGETEDDFNQTVSLMEKADFDYAFMYYYNPRENTRAFEMPNQLDEETKKSRLAKIVEIQRNRSLEKMRKKIGETQMVLVEGISKGNEAELIGRTEHDEHLVFPAPSSLVGKFVKVEINDLTGSTFRGKIVT